MIGEGADRSNVQRGWRLEFRYTIIRSRTRVVKYSLNRVLKYPFVFTCVFPCLSRFVTNGMFTMPQAVGGLMHPHNRNIKKPLLFEGQGHAMLLQPIVSSRAQ